MPITRLYAVFFMLAILAAAFAYVLHRRWIPRIGESETPAAEILYIVLLGIIGAPLSFSLRRGLGSFTVASLIAAAFLFAVAYGYAIHQGSHAARVSIAKQFASSMLLCVLVFLVLATAVGWNEWDCCR
jgi:hypothetical protein